MYPPPLVSTQGRQIKKMERARELVEELRALDVSHTELSTLGIRLSNRVRCSGVTRLGTQCTNTCPETNGRCAFHIRVRPVAATPHKCIEQTAKGETCKRTAFRGLDVCWRHGIQKGLVTNECSICYEMITSKDKKKTSCGHTFHASCLSKWFERSAEYRPPCPMCRHPLRRPASAAPVEEPVLILGTDGVWFLSTETPYMLAQDVPTFESA